MAAIEAAVAADPKKPYRPDETSAARLSMRRFVASRPDLIRAEIDRREAARNKRGLQRPAEPSAMGATSAPSSVLLPGARIAAEPRLGNHAAEFPKIPDYFFAGYCFAKPVRLFEIVKLPSARAATLIQCAAPV